MTDISVIILTYNKEKHIERAIKSMLNFAALEVHGLKIRAEAGDSGVVGDRISSGKTIDEAIRIS